MPESFERGALTEAVYYILLALNKPNHGYGIMQFIEQQTRGRVSLGAGTLYGALNTLVAKEWIELVGEEGAKRKKEYLMTGLGRDILNSEIKRLEELVKTGKRILKEV